jgi:hypothetical protein
MWVTDPHRKQVRARTAHHHRMLSHRPTRRPWLWLLVAAPTPVAALRRTVLGKSPTQPMPISSRVASTRSTDTTHSHAGCGSGSGSACVHVDGVYGPHTCSTTMVTSSAPVRTAVYSRRNSATSKCFRPNTYRTGKLSTGDRHAAPKCTKKSAL